MRILVSFLILFILCSCKGKEEKSNIESLNFSGQDTGASGNVTAGIDSLKFNELINTFSGEYNAAADWSRYGKNEKSTINKILINKYAIVPITKGQIKSIDEADFTDTSLVYIGEHDNAFVFVVDGGGRNIRKLAIDRNGLLLVKITGVSAARRLYLEKKHTDFLHKEIKVTEFTVTAEFIDAVSISAPDNILLEKFKVRCN